MSTGHTERDLALQRLRRAESYLKRATRNGSDVSLDAPELAFAFAIGAALAAVSGALEVLSDETKVQS